MCYNTIIHFNYSLAVADKSGAMTILNFAKGQCNILFEKVFSVDNEVIQNESENQIGPMSPDVDDIESQQYVSCMNLTISKNQEKFNSADNNQHQMVDAKTPSLKFLLIVGTNYGNYLVYHIFQKINALGQWNVECQTTFKRKDGLVPSFIDVIDTQGQKITVDSLLSGPINSSHSTQDGFSPLSKELGGSSASIKRPNDLSPKNHIMIIISDTIIRTYINCTNSKLAKADCPETISRAGVIMHHNISLLRSASLSKTELQISNQEDRSDIGGTCLICFGVSGGVFIYSLGKLDMLAQVTGASEYLFAGMDHIPLNFNESQITNDGRLVILTHDREIKQFYFFNSPNV